MTKTLALALVASGVLALAAAAAAAAPPSPTGAAAVDARKANFKEIGGAFKTIGDELKSGAPDLNAVRPAARDLVARSAQLSRLFPRGSGPESGAKTRAKADIWTDPAEFQKLETAFTTAANKLSVAAANGDPAALAGARGEVGAVCKSCHDRFRQTE